MRPMNTPFMTNVLLVIIAALLLVLVIQNGMQTTSTPASRSSGYHGHPPSSSSSGESRPSAMPQRPQGDMAAQMFFSALRGFPEGCDKSALLATCDSPQAVLVKKQISEYARGKRPRQVFDYIIKTWGEDALSDQAKRIRRQVRGK